MKTNPTLFCGQERNQNHTATATGSTSEQQEQGGFDATVEAVEAAVIDPITQYTDDMLKQFIKSKFRRRTVVLLVIGHVTGMIFMWFLMKSLSIKRTFNKTL